MTAQCHRADIAAKYNGWGETPQHDPEDVPNADCTCGIYAKHQPIGYTSSFQVMGVIEGWGRIEAGDESFRAQCARLVALCRDPTNFNPHLSEISETYNVPLFTCKEELIAKYPPSDISALLGEPEAPAPDPKKCPTCGISPTTMLQSRSLAIYGCVICGASWAV